VTVGALLAKPEGGLYFADEHASGGAARLALVEITWGRLVDVHGIDERGAPRSEPFLRDLVVNENLIVEPEDFTLEINPITLEARLIVQRVPGAPDQGSGTFEALVRRAMRDLGGVAPKSPDSTGSQPFSYVARNATLVLRFDDLLDDDEESIREISEQVRILTGYPPTVPLEARLVFDPNHGGIAGGRFHSTRVLVDLTTSEAELADSPVPLSLNSLGLPRSDRESVLANVWASSACSTISPAVRSIRSAPGRTTTRVRRSTSCAPCARAARRTSTTDSCSIPSRHASSVRGPSRCSTRARALPAVSTGSWS
jgi:hypothetical protein